MHFEPSEEQRLIETTARQFAEQVLKPAAAGATKGTVSRQRAATARGTGSLASMFRQYGRVASRGGGVFAGGQRSGAADASVSVAMAVTNMVAR